MGHDSIEAYNAAQFGGEREICESLMKMIDHGLADSDRRIWHAHPVWFLNGNPIVGYGKLKDCIRLMFWSGQSFAAKGLTKTGTFKAAELRLTSTDDIDPDALQNWLEEAKVVQWDYKNIQKRKGRLERLD